MLTPGIPGSPRRRMPRRPPTLAAQAHGALPQLRGSPEDLGRVRAATAPATGRRRRPAPAGALRADRPPGMGGSRPASRRHGGRKPSLPHTVPYGSRAAGRTKTSAAVEARDVLAGKGAMCDDAAGEVDPREARPHARRVACVGRFVAGEVERRHIGRKARERLEELEDPLSRQPVGDREERGPAPVTEVLHRTLGRRRHVPTRWDDSNPRPRGDLGVAAVSESVRLTNRSVHQAGGDLLVAADIS